MLASASTSPPASTTDEPDMLFHFRLIQEDGADLGTFSTSEPNWETGHLIQRGAGDVLEVVRLVDAADGDNVVGYLVVKAA
jgi:hypothetical protein